MKYGFMVTGPNSSGKTTAVERATAGYARDNRLIVSYADNRDRRMYQGDAEQMANLIQDLWLSPAQVVIVEGTRVPTLVERVYRRYPNERELLAFVTQTSPEDMETQLRNRCLKTGKRFRDDYWTRNKLVYEGSRRYRMSVPRFVPEEKIFWATVAADYGEAIEMSARMHQQLVGILGAPASDAEPLVIEAGKLF